VPVSSGIEQQCHPHDVKRMAVKGFVDMCEGHVAHPALQTSWIVRRKLAPQYSSTAKASASVCKVHDAKEALGTEFMLCQYPATSCCWATC
jgi:hypothetical protein